MRRPILILENVYLIYIYIYIYIFKMHRREFWKCQFTFFHCKLYIIFPLPKTAYYPNITWNVYYSFSPYIVGELTVNHLTVFTVKINESYGMVLSHFFLAIACLKDFAIRSVLFLVSWPWGPVHMNAHIFLKYKNIKLKLYILKYKTAAFSMRFGHLSTCKRSTGSLKPNNFENCCQGEDLKNSSCSVIM